jgi:hypothetical protein
MVKNTVKRPYYKVYVYVDGNQVVYAIYRDGIFLGTYDIESCMDRLAGIEIHELDETRAPSNYINREFVRSRVRKYWKTVEEDKSWESWNAPSVNFSSQEKPSAMPKSEMVSPGIDQIPFEFMEELGAIFAGGELKYGLDNWKQSPNDDAYNRERYRHALRHLMLWIGGDRSENHLAKVAWFCCTTIWREKHATNRT